MKGKLRLRWSQKDKRDKDGDNGRVQAESELWIGKELKGKPRND